MGADEVARQLEDEAWAIPDAWNVVTREIIAGAIDVHRALGPGLLERLYEEALEYELRGRGLKIDRQRQIRLTYRELELSPMQLDMVVNDLVVVEIKAVERVHDAHLAQLVGYLRGAQLPLGLVLNFHAQRLKDGLYRRVNPHSPLMPKVSKPTTRVESRSSSFPVPPL